MADWFHDKKLSPQVYHKRKRNYFGYVQDSIDGMAGLMYPAICINLTLALDMGWFEEDEDEDDPQFTYKLGPNLCIQLNLIMKFLPPQT